MLEGDRDETRQVGGIPVTEQLRAGLEVVAAELLPDHRRQGSRVLRESEWRLEPEVPLFEHDRIACGGVLLIALGEKDRGAEVDRPTPESGEEGTLDLHALHPAGIGRHLNGGYDLGE
jgi:hypothetical protein